MTSSVIGRLSGGLLELLFPSLCPFCGRIAEGDSVCRKCRAELPWAPEPGRRLEGVLPWAAALLYKDSVRECLLRLKFQGESALARPLGTLIARTAAEHFSGEFDIVTWAPVSRERLRERGYDQAELLAKAACRLWETEPVRLLEKTRNNPAQSGISDHRARQENVKNVYRGLPAAAGRRVLLIDDIRTTGATLDACAAALEEAGAERVTCVVLAQSPGG